METTGAPKPYAFGDTLNLDISATLFSAMQREGVKLPLNLEYSDLRAFYLQVASTCR